jgi:hypothetical protein
VRAFVAVAGVLQNGKWVLSNFFIVVYEGFWQFLIVCCGCSPCSDLQKYVLKQRKKSSTICPKPMKDEAEIHERCQGAVAFFVFLDALAIRSFVCGMVLTFRGFGFVRMVLTF